MPTLRINSTERRFVRGILVTVFSIIATFGFIFYVKLNWNLLLVPSRFASSRTPAVCIPNNSNRSVSSEISCDVCQLSLQESNGWFCDFDQDWKRRKAIHRLYDQQNRAADERKFSFLHNWDPTIHCTFERKIGKEDGGKWVCDVHKFRSIQLAPPLIYSFGSNGDFTFEKAIKQELPDSEIHTFDLSVYDCPPNVCQFHQVMIGGGQGDGSKSLQMILNDLGHQERDIDILKVDIEGHEFQLFNDLFKSTTRKKMSTSLASSISPYIRQILVEIHLKPNTSEVESRRAHTLFEHFRQNNYVIFHKEANINECKNVFEYAFIRLNPSFFS